MLDRKDVDAVVVTVPDQWHALMTVHACQAGKDVYCEKPLTLTIGEGPVMIAAARQHKRVVQTGSMQRSGQEFRTAVKLVRDEAIGKVKEVRVTLPPPNWTDRAKMPVPEAPPPDSLAYDAWLGPAQMRRTTRTTFTTCSASSGTTPAASRPTSGRTTWTSPSGVWAWTPAGRWPSRAGPSTTRRAGTRRPTSPRSSTPTPTGWWLTSVLGSESKSGEKQGTKFTGDKGTLFVYRGGITASSPDILKGVEWDKKASPNVAHVADFLGCVKTRKTPCADVAIGHRSATVCHLGNLAARAGRPLKWNPVSERFVGDAEADQWLMKEYRKGYSLS